MAVRRLRLPDGSYRYVWDTDPDKNIFRTEEAAARRGRVLAEAAARVQKSQQNAMQRSGKLVAPPTAPRTSVVTSPKDSEFADIWKSDQSVSRRIFDWQLRNADNAEFVQELPRTVAVKRNTKALKTGLNEVNEEHLARLRTGYFDRYYLEGARSVDKTFQMLPGDTAKVQEITLDHYTKMRNARAAAGRDSERYISHVWEDTPRRRKMFNRRTNLLNPNARNAEADAKNPMLSLTDRAGTLDKRYGVRAAVGADGRKWSLEKYSKMQGEAIGARLRNEGAIRAAERMGAKALLVSDGPGCGWSFHDDPQGADGMVVSMEEARTYPIAHPYCRRRFSPVKNPKDLKRKDEHLKGKREIAAKVLKGAAVTGLSLYAASAISNIMAGSAAKLAASRLMSDWINHLRALSTQGFALYPGKGYPAVTTMLKYSQWFTDTFGEGAPDLFDGLRRIGNVIEGPWAQRHLLMYPGGPLLDNLPGPLRELMVAGETYFNKAAFGQVGKKIFRRVEEFADNVLPHVSKVAPGERSEEQLALAYGQVKDFLRKRETRENITSVLNAEVQRRKYLSRFIKFFPGGDKVADKVSLHWTKWGEKYRIDLAPWMRGHFTSTPTGLIKAVSFFPAHFMESGKKVVRSALRMYQDGSIGGHISVLPKNFLRGMFRAVVEVDQHGSLQGNIRLIPGGPFKLRLEFITRTPKEVAEELARQTSEYIVVVTSGEFRSVGLLPSSVADLAVDFLKNHHSPLGFNINEFAGELVRNLRAAERISAGQVEDVRDALIAAGAKLTFDPRDIYNASKQFGAARVANDLGYMVRQFRLHRVVGEWRIFNKSVFDISANLRIPVKEVKGIIADLMQRKLVEEFTVSGGFTRNPTYSGLFRWVIKNPQEVWDSIKTTQVETIGAGGVPIRTTLFGNIRFSGLQAIDNTAAGRYLRMAKVRFLSAAHFDIRGLESVATNMRIFGWTIYDIANVLKVRPEDIRRVWASGIARIRLMQYNFGFTKLDDAIPFWDEKVQTVMQMLRPSDALEGSDPVNRAEALLRITKTIKADKTNPAEERALRYLAGIHEGDPKKVVELKLLHLRNWMRVVEAREEIVWRMPDPALGLPRFDPVTGLRLVVEDEGRQLIYDLYRQLGQVAEDISIDDVRAKAAVMVKPQELNRIKFGDRKKAFYGQGMTSRVVDAAKAEVVNNATLSDMFAQRMGISETVYRGMSPEMADDLSQWRNAAVAESRTSFRVGRVRFTIDPAAFDDFAGGDEFTSLLDVIDDNVVENTLSQYQFLARRFPDTPLPEVRFHYDLGEYNTAYYENGIIHLPANWADDFYTAMDDYYDLVTRYNGSYEIPHVIGIKTPEDAYNYPIFHEFGHSVYDYVDDETIDAISEVIERKYGVVLPKLRDIPAGHEGERYWWLRKPLEELNDPAKLEAIQRDFGLYAADNADEMFAEAIRMYLTQEDVAPVVREIGGMVDQAIIGKSMRTAAEDAARGMASLGAEERRALGTVLNVNIPGSADRRVIELVQDIAGETDALLDPENVTDNILERYFYWRVNQGGDSLRQLDDAIEEHWQDSFDKAKRIRAAHMAIQGQPMPGVHYDEVDVISALRLEKRFSEEGVRFPTLYRAVHEDLDDPNSIDFINRLLTEGHEETFPISGAAPTEHIPSYILLGSRGGGRNVMLQIVDTHGLPIGDASDYGEVLVRGKYRVASVTEHRLNRGILYDLDLDESEFQHLEDLKVFVVRMEEVVDGKKPSWPASTEELFNPPNRHRWNSPDALGRTIAAELYNTGEGHMLFTGPENFPWEDIPDEMVDPGLRAMLTDEAWAIVQQDTRNQVVKAAQDHLAYRTRQALRKSMVRWDLLENGGGSNEPVGWIIAYERLDDPVDFGDGFMAGELIERREPVKALTLTPPEGRYKKYILADSDVVGIIPDPRRRVVAEATNDRFRILPDRTAALLVRAEELDRREIPDFFDDVRADEYSRGVQNWIHNEYGAMREVSKDLQLRPDSPLSDSFDVYEQQVRAINETIEWQPLRTTPLFRSMSVSDRELGYLRRMVASESPYRLPLSSFTDNEEVATNWSGGSGSNVVIFKVDGLHRSIQIKHLSSAYNESEWLSHGEFIITRVELDETPSWHSRPRYIVHMEQVSTAAESPNARNMIWEPLAGHGDDFYDDGQTYLTVRMLNERRVDRGDFVFERMLADREHTIIMDDRLPAYEQVVDGTYEPWRYRDRDVNAAKSIARQIEERLSPSERATWARTDIWPYQAMGGRDLILPYVQSAFNEQATPGSGQLVFVPMRHVHNDYRDVHMNNDEFLHSGVPEHVTLFKFLPGAPHIDFEREDGMVRGFFRIKSIEFDTFDLSPEVRSYAQRENIPVRIITLEPVTDEELGARYDLIQHGVGQPQVSPPAIIRDGVESTGNPGLDA